VGARRRGQNGRQGAYGHEANPLHMTRGSSSE
jgi:hypothetical protein